MIKGIEAKGDYFICPYCGKTIRINPEIFSDYAMEDEADVFCEECDHEFHAVREVSFHYLTFRKLQL